jgi:hypothetical protein
MTKITDRLSRIQKALKAPKEENKNVSYKSRSAEQILEAAKDVLEDGEYLSCTDEIVLIGERYYVKATATFGFGSETLSASGWAREPKELLSSNGKPLMQEPQLTGASSSYSRKYALGGLLAIDDSKDDPDKQSLDDVKSYKEATREDKAFMRDFLYALGNTEDVPSLIEEMGDKFDSLPDELNEQITGQIEVRKTQIKNNVQAIKPVFKFLDVQEAGEFGVTAKHKIDTEKNIDDLREWMAENDHKLKALDVMLNAKKYQTPEGTPYQRLKNAYNKRIQPIAAE